MTDLIIVGAGGHGKVVADIALKQKRWKCISFIDDRFPELSSVFNLTVVAQLCDINDFKADSTDFIVAIGDNKTRLLWANKLIEQGLNLVSIFDHSAVISPSAQIDVGSVIFPNAVINADASLGIATIINTSAVVEHDCVLSNGVHVSPGALLGGNVTLAECCWIGTGASVKQGVCIGSNTIVGLGAAVINDLAENVVAVGIPAKERSVNKL